MRVLPDVITELEQVGTQTDNITQVLQQLLARMYDLMLARDANKYAEWLKVANRLNMLLRVSFVCAQGKERSDVLKYLYALFRLLDDLADGDVQVPQSHASAAAYLEEKISFVHQIRAPQDTVERLFAYVLETANGFGADLREGCIAILESLLFDARRLGAYQVYAQTDLEAYLWRRDGDGTAAMMLQVLDEDVGQVQALRNIINAVRVRLDLCDLETDLSKGFVNVSVEDATSYGLSDKDWRQPESSVGLAQWKRDKAQDAVADLNAHRELFPTLALGKLTKLILHRGYEIPTRRKLASILESN